ncbi:MAG: hypothetical protein JGK24_17645 [Microcoleus sp. PH2017_29_MFU_D_A]|uniref:hypothetical protein n=1 Tax=unclassified Microcoleus TaxID=2642155 RepID=UPI001DB3C1EE|nr:MULTISPECIES: hypothetical protein [unclassified Microcoleus]MCC3418049.1 hypothetical protein [Microcoleus sp. PH2017_07_MST_O_A]MCC3433596.1 hypothetical protein [Microcoleus sp. PH2017_04_SCI_O_A]MCC3464784.1 hypothetical protein [Microcoleus sp. PH2017_06_SFM_O_A]MCC3501864.1 hypothetical protein [Microcoleus sp. PH2017_19_SFW_U_A]MCC3507943.1 hypothetical protein [Microcoleus sp. PH2017_17_BER_D_A]TAE05994.1 MAG: hypothetical protein EAZ94_31325 [Oscillatoriales cyanobacterium]
MSAVTLTDRQIWDELAKLLAPINIDRIATQHLEACNYTIRGYWDSNNKFYEEIALIHPICADLIGRSIGTNLTNNHPNSDWIKLKILLKADLSASKKDLVNDEEDDEIGELTLILDTNLKVIDENWSIDLESPFVIAKIQPN